MSQVGRAKPPSDFVGDLRSDPDVVGAQLDQGRAATLAFVLLAFALGAFFLQRRILGNKVYTTLSGKGDMKRLRSARYEGRSSRPAARKAKTVANTSA